MAKKEGISQEMFLQRLKRVERQVHGIKEKLIASRDYESLVSRHKPDKGLVFNDYLICVILKRD